jgi:4-alpha-glucanotransferase
MLREWVAVLASHGLLRAGSWPSPAELTVALHRMLTATPALLIGVSLADAVGDLRAQNIPGTTDEYPNWRIPLCDAEGKPVLLADLDEAPLVRAVAGAVRGPAG